MKRQRNKRIFTKLILCFAVLPIHLILTALAEDMFFLLRMDDPNYVPAMESTDLCEFLRKICAEYYEEIEDTGLRFSIEIPEESILASLDEGLFARVIGTLLSNALKYNRTGKQIGISLKKCGSQAAIEIFDDGQAIDAALDGQMFTAHEKQGK